MRFLTHPHVSTTADGFTVTAPNGDCNVVRWTAVKRIATFKYDLWAVDEIVLEFESDDHPGLLLEVSEDWEGFRTLTERMESELGVGLEWWGEVVCPAFATNYRVIYQRDAQVTPSLVLKPCGEIIQATRAAVDQC